jgi:hypothetical protein
VTLTGAPTTPNDGVARGLVVNGGELFLFSEAPTPTWTKLGEHAASGARSLVLKDAVNWQSGDSVVIAPTEYYGVAATERVELAAAAAGSRVQTSAALGSFHWGALQYVTSSGMSLTPDAGFVPPATPFPTVLDERAAVGNLSRRIVIQGADDTAWRNTGFGAHVMIMGLQSRVAVDGVEFRRVGQAGTTGRYPFHWHLLSYSSQGSFLGDATGHVLRNSSIWASSQRCVVIHGTNGVHVLNNICYDIKGHAYFLEDAVERRNVLDGNLALMVRAPADAQRLQLHESTNGEGGPSGFWVTNPDNVVRNNHAGDSVGNGFWFAFPARPLGLNSQVPILPNRIRLGEVRDNTAHSSRGAGFLLRGVPVDAAGTIDMMPIYIPTSNEQEDATNNRVRFTIQHSTAFKNLDGAYRNRVSFPDYTEWVTADNVGTVFAGSTLETNGFGLLTRSLIVSASLNNRTPYPTDWWAEPPVGTATYHSTMAVSRNTFVNFAFVDNKSSGAFKTNDYYLRPVERGTARNDGNRLVNSAAGFRTLPPNLDGQPLANRHWTQAGAVWDPEGYWGTRGNYHVFDVPFLTAGGNCVPALPAGRNGQSCAGEYYGVSQLQTDFDSSRWMFVAPIEVTRINAGGTPIGTWSVADGATSTMLGNMRHFAARQDGRYILRFPNRPLPRAFSTTIDNAYRGSDAFLMAVAFDGSVNAAGYVIVGEGTARHVPNANSTRNFVAAGNLAEVENSSGDRIWQDRANNLVWFKVAGGRPWPGTLVHNSDEDLYRQQSVVLRAQ